MLNSLIFGLLVEELLQVGYLAWCVCGGGYQKLAGKTIYFENGILILVWDLKVKC